MFCAATHLESRLCIERNPVKHFVVLCPFSSGGNNNHCTAQDVVACIAWPALLGGIGDWALGRRLADIQEVRGQSYSTGVRMCLAGGKLP